VQAINAPEVVAEIGALHDAYEQALIANDVAALGNFFWVSPEVVRFGVSEHLYGAEAIAAYRQNYTPVFSDRKLLRRSILTLGPDVASVMCELSQLVKGELRHSRQSQVWSRFPDAGWKIVAAHVSNALGSPPDLWAAYADRVATAIGLPLSPAHRPGVVQNLARTAAIAAPLLAFPLPTEIEPAPVFTA